LATWLLLVSSVSATTLEPLKFTPQQQRTTAEVVSQLTGRHYRSQAFDNELSSRYLDNLLKNLDPGKSFFFQADIDEFEKHRTKFDDYFKKGDLKVGFEIFDRYRQRVVTRLESVISILESEDSKFDFDVEESLTVDWDKAVWPTDKKSADQHWHKRMKSGLLSLKLAGKNLEESKEILLKRFQGQLRRVKQQNEDEAFEVVINALTTLYDPHTNYLGPRTLENFNINMSLSLEGIGAVLQTEDEYTKVMRLVPAGPAA
jgi:carboxyl-terminal processing protease